MIGFRIKAANSTTMYTVYTEDRVYDYILSIAKSEELAIEASSWAELAYIGEVYEHDQFTVEVIEE